MLNPDYIQVLSTEMMAAALDACGDSVEIDDLTGRVLYVNQAWCDYFGGHRNKLVGKKWVNLIDLPLYTSLMKKSWDKCIAEGTAQGKLVLGRSNGYEHKLWYTRILFSNRGDTDSAIITTYRSSNEPVGLMRLRVDESQLMASLSRHVPKVDAVLDHKELGQPISGGASLYPQSSSLVGLLAKRELDVLRLVAFGYSNREIAQELMVEVSTVKSHLNNLYRKLGIKSRLEALVYAREIDVR